MVQGRRDERLIRVPAELVARADALIEALEARDKGAVRWTPTAVIRLAVTHGLERLEATAGEETP